MDQFVSWWQEQRPHHQQDKDEEIMTLCLPDAMHTRLFGLLCENDAVSHWNFIGDTLKS